MSADRLAELALSPLGKFHAQVERAYGRDPAAFLERFDEVLAHDYRTALLITREPPEPPEEPTVDDRPGIVTDLEEQMKALEARFK